ncbi:hypothetical protein, partial [Helicobacter pylori]|uniref:hypothetical protein n=1 Tax=Helicobacter pylori TaxID=210 RepID=UPI001E4A931C
MTKKKKRFHAIMLLIHSNANAFLMYEIPNIKIQSNPKRRKHEKNPFTLSLSRFCSTLKTTAF